jgi:hypothetical protein
MVCIFCETNHVLFSPCPISNKNLKITAAWNVVSKMTHGHWGTGSPSAEDLLYVRDYLRKYIVYGYLRDVIVMYDTVENSKTHGAGTCHLVLIPPGSNLEHCKHLKGIFMVVDNFHAVSFGLPAVMSLVMFMSSIPNLKTNPLNIKLVKSNSVTILKRIQSHVNLREIVVQTEAVGHCQDDVIQTCGGHHPDWRILLVKVGRMTTPEITQTITMTRVFPEALVKIFVDKELEYHKDLKPTTSCTSQKRRCGGDINFVMSGRSFVNVLKNFNMKLAFVKSLALIDLSDKDLAWSKSQFVEICCLCHGCWLM